MKEMPLISQKRQQELIVINQMLALIVVFLSGILIYKIILQNRWNFSQTDYVSSEQILRNTNDTVYTIPTASASALVTISASDRLHRTILAAPINSMHVQRLLWLAQGKITPWGERTVASYKSSFPIELYVYIRQITGMQTGLYHYDAKSQQLNKDNTVDTMKLALDQPSLRTAPVVIFAITKDSQDIQSYVEAGGIMQQIVLGAAEMKLATYYIPTVPNQLQLPFINNKNQALVWIMPIGLPNPDSN